MIYTIKATKEVHDMVESTFTVDAANEEEAGTLARAKLEAGDCEWDFSFSLNDGDVDVEIEVTEGEE